MSGAHLGASGGWLQHEELPDHADVFLDPLVALISIWGLQQQFDCLETVSDRRLDLLFE